MLEAVCLLWWCGQWPARSCIVHCDANSAGKARGSSVSAQGFWDRNETAAVEFYTLGKLAGLESSAPHFQAAWVGLTAGIDSTKNNGSWDASAVSDLFHMCSAIIGLSGPTTTCSFDQAQRNFKKNPSSSAQTLLLDEPGETMKLFKMAKWLISTSFLQLESILGQELHPGNQAFKCRLRRKEIAHIPFGFLLLKIPHTNGNWCPACPDWTWSGPCSLSQRGGTVTACP